MFSVSLVAFVMVPKLKVIGSWISTSVSSKPVVEIVILAEVPFAGITICLTSSTIINSSSNTAEEASWVIVNGMVISAPESLVAVKVTVVDEFSSIVGEENSNITSDSVSLSSNSNVTGIATPSATKASLYIAFTGVPGETTSDSVSSNSSSSIPAMLKVPVVCPAGIFIWGSNWYELSE